MEWLSRPLSEQGYTVLVQRFRDDRVRAHLRDVEDIRSAISHLQGLSYVDPQRIGVIGHSAGGRASLLAAAKDPRVKSTVALAPVTEHLRRARGMRDYAPSRYEQHVKAQGGRPEEIPEYYREGAPLTYADQIKTPVLLIHGMQDFNVPHDHSQWMYDALVKAGNSRVKIELLPGLGHFFEGGFQPHRLEKVVGLLTPWLAETLK